MIVKSEQNRIELVTIPVAYKTLLHYNYTTQNQPPAQFDLKGIPYRLVRIFEGKDLQGNYRSVEEINTVYHRVVLNQDV